MLLARSPSAVTSWQRLVFANITLLIGFSLLILRASAQPTFVVESTQDAGDEAPGNDVCDTGFGTCTARSAIPQASASSGPDSIHFAISGTGTISYQIDSTRNVGVLATSTALPEVDFYRADPDAEEGKASLGMDVYKSIDYGGCGSPPCVDPPTFTPKASIATHEKIVATATDIAGDASEISPITGMAAEDSLAVTSFQPETGTPGTLVRIYGTGFSPMSSNNTVTFGGATATVDSAKGSVLYAQVPSGATGPVDVAVSTRDATASASGRFVVVTGGNGSFASTGALLTGVALGSIDWGDFDADGDLDLVIAGENENGNPTTKIYRNEGGGTFTEIGAGLKDVGVEGPSANWGDFDGDGDLDLLVTGADHNSETARIYRNEGGGTFSEIGADLTGVYRSSSDWGDFDGDGDLDLVVTGNFRTNIYRNEGGGTFTEIEAGLTNVDAGSSDWGDFDADGDLDLVISGDSRQGFATKLYRNRGEGTFTEVDAGLTGVVFSSSDWGDFDGDGDLDLVITGLDTSIARSSTLYRNDGEGTFTEVEADLAGVDGGTAEWGDFDGDGDPDLVISGRDTSGGPFTTLYRNDGNEQFTNVSAGVINLLGSSANWGDVEGDGDLDLVITGRNANDSLTATVYENGAGPKITLLRPESGTPGTRVRIYGSDFSLTPSENTVTFGGAHATVDSAKGNVLYTRVPSSVYGPVDVTVNVDGAEETSSRTFLGIDPNQPSGQFENLLDITTQREPRAISVGDWDGDQEQDLAVAVAAPAAEDAKVVVFRNDGSGTFARVDSMRVAPDPSSLTAGDLDGDGALDLFVSSNGTSAFTPEYEGGAVLINGGNGRFTEQTVADVEGCEFPATLGDWDGDGDLDAALPAHCSFGISILENDGAGGLAENERLDVGYHPASVTSLDLDNDGELELAVPDRNDTGSRKGRVVLYENDGQGQFSELTRVGVQGGHPQSVASSDFNGDGKLDIAASWTLSGPSGGGVSVLANQGGSTFTEDAVLGSTTVRDFSIGDYDGDGDPDLAMPQPDSSHLLIYTNDGSGQFALSRAVSTGTPPDDVKNIDVDGDGDLDLVVTREETKEVTILENQGGPLEPPSDFTVSTGEGQVELRWSHGGEESPVGYSVYRSTSSFDSAVDASKLNNSPITRTAYIDASVQQGTTYYYRVTAIGKDGNESKLSDEAKTVLSDGAISFINPVENGSITHYYANHEDVDEDGNHEYHAGIDLDSPTNDCSSVDCPVRAAAPGTVQIFPDEAENHDLGKVVIIEHPKLGLYTLYAHLASISVSDDDSVSAGDEIGIMGETGFANGIHLHFEVKDRGVLGAGRNNDEGPWAYTPESDAPAPTTPNKPGHPNWFGYHDPNLLLNNEVETLENPVPIEVLEPPLEVRDYPSTDSDLSLVITEIPARTDGKDPAFVSVRSVGDRWYQVHLPNDPPNDGITEGWSASGWIKGTLDGTTFSQPDESLTEVEVTPESARIYSEPSEKSRTLSFTYGGDLAYREQFVSFESTSGWHRIYLTEKSGKRDGWVSSEAVVEAATASETATVSSSGLVDFGETGTDIEFSGVKGSGDVTVKKHNEPPSNVQGISESTVSAYRFVIDAQRDLSFDSNTEVRLDVSTLSGIDEPGEVKIYQRSTVGQGAFADLPTQYDAGANELKTTTGSFSEFVLASNSEPLPVELAQFGASVEDEEVLLKWQTGSETNNSGFAVQRRASNTKSWTRLTFIDGAGTSSTPQTYRYRDIDLPYEADSFDYRLMQVDADGSTSFSEQVTVHRGTPENVELLGTFPNPAQQYATVRYALPDEQKIKIHLYDMLGRRVVTLDRGRHDAGRKQFQLDTSQLSAGMYFLRLIAEGTTKTQRLTVVR